MLLIFFLGVEDVGCVEAAAVRGNAGSSVVGVLALSMNAMPFVLISSGVSVPVRRYSETCSEKLCETLGRKASGAAESADKFFRLLTFRF